MGKTMKTQHRQEILTAIDTGIYDVTDDGIYFPHQCIMPIGGYFHRVNNEDLECSSNLITAKGIDHMLNVAMGAKVKALWALISATKYTAARTFQDGDVYSVGYRVGLSN